MTRIVKPKRMKLRFLRNALCVKSTNHIRVPLRHASFKHVPFFRILGYVYRTCPSMGHVHFFHQALRLSNNHINTCIILQTIYSLLQYLRLCRLSLTSFRQVHHNRGPTRQLLQRPQAIIAQKRFYVYIQRPLNCPWRYHN